HDHSHHLENDGFSSLSLQFDRPFAIRKFQYFLDNQLPESVFRAKGILWFDESPQRHIFHLSGKRFTLEDEEWKGEKENKLVLIGQNIDKDLLRQQIENCVCLPKSDRGRGFGK
ncbi:GTP-binding protein, partial [Waterburya agarophytonicola K14]